MNVAGWVPNDGKKERGENGASRLTGGGGLDGNGGEKELGRRAPTETRERIRVRGWGLEG
ncbi:hypothetical protein CsSME_00035952 [Camellia sinensis var. sinensis]